MQTYTNATFEIAGMAFELGPGGVMVPPPDAPPGPLFRQYILDEPSALGAIAGEARAGTVGIKGLARQIERLFLGRGFHCWKCADGRTRGHHRLCAKRGRGGPDA